MRERPELERWLREADQVLTDWTRSVAGNNPYRFVQRADGSQVKQVLSPGFRSVPPLVIEEVVFH